MFKIGDVVRHKKGKGLYNDDGTQIGIIIKKSFSINKWFYKIHWFGLDNTKRYWSSPATSFEKIC